jgi:hypothetical protein
METPKTFLIDLPQMPAEGCTSALGHKPTFALQKVMSALPPKADIRDAS